MTKPRRVLFVCMGNICRSPAAEGVFLHMVRERGLEKEFRIDSAGTLGYHTGELPDPRMRAAAERRGYRLESRARQVRREDLEAFDLVIAMDRDNQFHLHSLDRAGTHRQKIRLLCDWFNDPAQRDVPDPYYGGPEDFERVLDMAEVCCERLLDDVTKP